MLYVLSDEEGKKLIKYRVRHPILAFKAWSKKREENRIQTEKREAELDLIKSGDRKTF